MLTYCPNFHALAVQDFQIGMEKRIAVRLRCKMWTCEYCSEKNRLIWRAKLLHHIAHSDLTQWSWFTLTAHRYARGEEKSLANLRGAWDTLVKRMKRKFGDFQYARVYEKHKDGSYHIHAICSFLFSDIRVRVSRKSKKRTSYSHWLQKTAWELGIGMYTHAENVPEIAIYNADNALDLSENDVLAMRSGFVASYITKYIVKLEAQTKSEFGRIRHIQTSRGWLKAPEYQSTGEFKFKFGLYVDDIIHAHENGYRFELNGYKPDYEDFEESYIYPADFK
jgi:hypothetical protein